MKKLFLKIKAKKKSYIIKNFFFFKILKNIIINLN